MEEGKKLGQRPHCVDNVFNIMGVEQTTPTVQLPYVQNDDNDYINTV